ncbi:MAG: hypothetical protein AAFP82_05215, partial [Bacteroidota bacterium]
MLYFSSESSAQSGVNCTLEDANGEVVVVELTISNEVQINPTQCLYNVNLTISAVDGMADQDVQVRIQAGTLLDIVAVLPMGQSSATIINNITLFLDCGFIANVQFTVLGNPMSTCLDQALFPVEFTKFEAKATESNEVKLIWETASETDNEGFDIERSRDGYK